jgi:hypothetical protein
MIDEGHPKRKVRKVAEDPNTAGLTRADKAVHLKS